MKSNKFALVGTSCVGKTTLFLELSSELKEKYKNKKIITVPEAARFYFENKRVRRPFSYINQRNIQDLAIHFEKKVEQCKPDIIICDRSVLDAIAYVKTKGTEKEVARLLKRVTKWLTTYNHIFLLSPKGIKYETDHIRKEDSQLRELFHISFLNLLEKLNLPYTLITGEKKRRLKKMSRIISTFIL